MKVDLKGKVAPGHGRRAGLPSDIATAANFVTGQIIIIDGGQSLPGASAAAMAARL